MTILSVLFVISTGYWMAFRIRSEKVDEPDAKETDPEKAENIQDVIGEENSKQWSVFNACMVVISFYLSMLCSAWYDGDVTQRPTAVFQFTSSLTFWLYNCSIWIAFLVFLYAAVIPVLNQDRTY